VKDGDLVFVDADDTLWENYRWFQAVLDYWVRVLAGHGVDGDKALATLHATEDRNIPVTGYGAAPFVRSAVEAFHALVPHADHATRNDVAHFAKLAERSIREHPIALLPGVREAIPVLAETKRIVVLTKGQEDEQRAKVERSGLARWFAGVRVVGEKDPSAYSEAARAFGAAPSACWMVGNSPASDVNPAIAAGLRAIHVPHAAPWHRDAGAVDPRALVARTFADVPSLVAGRPGLDRRQD
jgi:putative hydrolase of the HAD superfamily